MPSNRNIGELFTCRRVLNAMVISGFMANYMLRVNMTIAIVSMVIPSNESSRSVEYHVSNECTIAGNNVSDSSVSPVGSATHRSFEESGQKTRYPWNEYQVNLVLGSFFWGYVCTELPGGRLAEIVGPKRVFGYSMLLSSILTLLTPLSAAYGYVTVAGLRAVLGFTLGVTWPAIQPMTARWIPPTERSRFVSNMMASSLGAAITMPICGFLIASIGWESVFYVTGAIGLGWSLAWFLLIFDSPAQHPRISVGERRYIERAIGSTATTERLPVPWKSILLSVPVWAIVVAHGCSVFGYFTVVNQLPTYMKYILNFDIKENGILSSLPYLGKYAFAVTTSVLADHLVKTKKMSITAIRKAFTAFAVLSPGLLMIVQAYRGCDRVASVSIFTVALTINGAVTAGYLGNSLDIAPNFSGTIFGIANTFSSLGGFLSSYMVGTITYKNQTYARWSIVFWVLASTYVVGGLAFVAFGSGELQKWNNPEEMEDRKKPDEAEKSHDSNNESISLKDKSIP